MRHGLRRTSAKRLSDLHCLSLLGPQAAAEAEEKRVQAMGCYSSLLQDFC